MLLKYSRSCRRLTDASEGIVRMEERKIRRLHAREHLTSCRAHGVVTSGVDAVLEW